MSILITDPIIRRLVIRSHLRGYSHCDGGRFANRAFFALRYKGPMRYEYGQIWFSCYAISLGPYIEKYIKEVTCLSISRTLYSLGC